MGAEYWLTRSVFLRALAAIYAVAFASYWIQYPGLFGCDGLQPSGEFLLHVVGAFPTNYTRVLPTLAWLAVPLPVHIDTLLELFSLTGLVLSLAAATTGLIAAPLFAVLWLLYASLVQSSQVFMAFQWDQLLLEVGFASVLLAPWSVSDHLSARASRLPPLIGIWVLRIVFFKLMLMSGVVKLSSLDPSWTQLSALAYHFATQCIPTPLAWWAHQLPEVVQRIGTALVFVIEIPCAFLLIAPDRLLRILGAAIQVALQVLIALTGNYTFFNLLTAALAIPCLDDAFIRRCARLPHPEPPAPASATATAASVSPTKRVLRITLRLVVPLAGVSALVSVIARMFDVSWLGPDGPLLLALSFSVRRMQDTLQVVLPGTAVFLLAELGYAVFRTLWALRAHVLSGRIRTRRALGQLAAVSATGTLALLLVVASLSALIPLAPKLTIVAPASVVRMADTAAQLRVGGSYGLFRSMTGVGPDFQCGDGRRACARRPEVVLEGTADGSHWMEIPFRYKPGNVSRAPVFVAPYQPRLDWQMWFAALGDYGHHSWAVHLAYKVLRGSPAVYALLSPQDNPFSAAKPPIRVRMLLYEYTFTRDASSDAWWTRQRKGEWLPPLEADNPSLQQFLIGSGYSPAVNDSCNDVRAPVWRALRRALGDGPAPLMGTVLSLVAVSWVVQWWRARQAAGRALAAAAAATQASHRRTEDTRPGTGRAAATAPAEAAAAAATTVAAKPDVGAASAPPVTASAASAPPPDPTAADAAAPTLDAPAPTRDAAPAAAADVTADPASAAKTH